MADIRIGAKAKYKEHCGKPVYRVSYALLECKLTEKYPECNSRNNGVCLASHGCTQKRKETERLSQHDLNLRGLRNSRFWKCKLNGLIVLNGRKLTDEEARLVINKGIENGYGVLSEIPDETAEQWLTERGKQ